LGFRFITTLVRRRISPVKPIGGLSRRAHRPTLAHGGQSPQMRRNRPSRGIKEASEGQSDYTHERATLFLLKTAARPNRYQWSSPCSLHRTPPLTIPFLLRV
jgi:hypothetical protein